MYSLVLVITGLSPAADPVEIPPDVTEFQSLDLIMPVRLERPRDVSRVRLFVSVDRGLTWKHFKDAGPNDGRIAFSAPRDDLLVRLQVEMKDGERFIDLRRPIMVPGREGTRIWNDALPLGLCPHDPFRRPSTETRLQGGVRPLAIRTIPFVLPPHGKIKDKVFTPILHRSDDRRYQRKGRFSQYHLSVTSSPPRVRKAQYRLASPAMQEASVREAIVTRPKQSSPRSTPPKTRSTRTAETLAFLSP